MSSTARTSADIPLISIAAAAPQSSARLKRWNREEYYRLAEQGWFDVQRVELINGEIYELSPQSPEHAWSIHQIARILQSVFGQGYLIRVQSPLTVDEQSEPEPDVAVLMGDINDFLYEHPKTCVLAVEISKTTQVLDKEIKAGVYARAAVQEYWVLDLERRELVVHRQPRPDAAAPQQPEGVQETAAVAAYGSVEIIPEAGTVSPIGLPQAKLSVGQMLPPTKAK